MTISPRDTAFGSTGWAGAHPLAGNGSAHVVQFYESDDYLSSLVSDFIGDGLNSGEPSVIIATEPHRVVFVNLLAQKGLDVDGAVASGRLTLCDARETLATFMRGAMPDAEQFRATVGAMIAARAQNASRIRAYGEMVHLLWRDGNPEAAVRLEELWNDLAGQYTFALLCAYPMGNFYKESDAPLFARVCETHGLVVPTERYTNVPDEAARAVEISLLQQQAEALRTEIVHRKELEDERRRAAEDKEFLLEVTTALIASLDYGARVRELPELLVPRIADWCAIDVVRDGTRERVIAGLAEHENGEARIAAPLCIGERSAGTLTLVRAHRPFTPADHALVAELTRRVAFALENARLYELAQRANRTKDEFLATLSHELRTPLTAILGWARMLNLGGLDADTTRTAYNTIERSARAQATLIDDLLDLSKVVTGKLTLGRELVDLATAVENAVETQRLAAEGKGIHLDVSGTAERIVITGDATRLQQIIWNLLSNAIKFSDAGSHVSVAIERAGNVARVIVRDTGRGISSEFLPHVFEAFRQEDGANTRKYGGLGLGLAIVKYLTELHGGTVQASSGGLSLGATFIVTLPLTLPDRGMARAR